MNYYVVGPDGQKYGPTDLAGLNAWISDGRLFPQSYLEEESTGRVLPASSLGGLRFAPPPSATPGAPFPSYGTVPQPRVSLDSISHGNFLGSLGVSALSFTSAFFFGIASLFLSFWALRLAWDAKEEDEHPAWWLAVLLPIAALCLAGYVRLHRVR